MVSIIIAGDTVPTDSNLEYFNRGETEALLGNELSEIWEKSDFRIFNLEAPLTDRENPIVKCGPNLRAPLSASAGIKALRPELIGLANNHIMDQGTSGLNDTLHILEQDHIAVVGAGANLQAAAAGRILEKNGLKIGVYACAEHEFSIAAEDKAGANPFDPLYSLDHIAELKHKVDKLLVLYHGGKEHYRYPSPRLQQICRRMIEKGADLVICQHSHCIGAWESFLEGDIIYGQGNFIFDYSNQECWNSSLLVRMNFSEKNEIEFIPIVRHGNVIRLATLSEKAQILNAFKERSLNIQRQGFVEQEYRTYCDNMGPYYLRTYARFNRILRGLDRLSGARLIRWFYKGKSRIVMENYLECESHRELVVTYLKSLNKTI